MMESSHDLKIQKVMLLAITFMWQHVKIIEYYICNYSNFRGMCTMVK
jgi:hypothetical protein